MKSHVSAKRIPTRLRAAFTLIELLIVIVIIAVLAGVAFPVTAMVMDAARNAEAKNEVRNIANAISMYELEYGRLPLPAGSGGDMELATDNGTLMAVLSGENVDDLNPKEKVFYEGKQAKGIEQELPTGGIYGSGQRVFLADPWGGPYYVMIDADYDGKLTGIPGMEGEELRKKVAVWSEGKISEEGEASPVEKWHTNWR